MSAWVNHLATVLPEHRIDQDEIRRVGRRLLSGKVPFLDRALDLFSNAGVKERFLVRPIDELLEHGDLGWRNHVFREESIRLGERLLRRLLEESGTEPEEIDMVITTSCTGFMIPSLDAFLINAFGMRSDTKRLPITELGCAAGAMALSRAHEYLRAFPDHKVVVLALELPSLTVQTDDVRIANVVSAALFGDGGAAALLSGEPGPCELLGSRSHFFYQTPELMGFDLDARGFRIILDKKISGLILSDFAEPVSRFLAERAWRLDDVDHFVFHPGGRRIMDSLKKVLALDEADIAVSRHVLERVGNLSSASVLWVLRETLARGAEGNALMAAFGPGFNAELSAVRLHGSTGHIRETRHGAFPGCARAPWLVGTGYALPLAAAGEPDHPAAHDRVLQPSSRPRRLGQLVRSERTPARLCGFGLSAAAVFPR